MGVEPYNFVSSLNCVLAQRLVRLICPACKRPHRPSSEELIQSGLGTEEYSNRIYYESSGCLHCNRTGYRGRTAIHELLGLTDNIRDLIVERRPSSEIRRAAQAEGLLSLRASALEKLTAGLTSLREINRVTFAEGANNK
jgi:type IV pilus assembly protein PilB